MSTIAMFTERWGRIEPVLPPLNSRVNQHGQHGIGRSRGGLTSKTHALVDGKSRPSVLRLQVPVRGDAELDVKTTASWWTCPAAA